MSSPIASSYDGSCAAVGKIPQGAKNPPQLGRCCLNESSFRSKAIDESSASCGPAICLLLWYLQSPAMARAATEAAEEEKLSLGNRCCRGRSGRRDDAQSVRGGFRPKKVVGCGSQSRGAYRGPNVAVRSRPVRLEAPVLSGQQVLQMLSERRRAAKVAEIAWSQVVEGQSCPGGRERRVSQTSRQCYVRAAEAVAKGASTMALVVTTSTASEGELSKSLRRGSC